ncbi:putative Cystatin domain-containing protein [Rosa chinensis]|uniref:Putative Cystatin domain-containing protein n=1 Tax=Rosa chinensis TaxID=74649 RepID=A0A2P6SA78_ROSCH|nr:cysteine proteinase inhibitor 7 isoform X2 [Rosa chinensis]PRQ55600.1 putative Cystatin domain-containing protein [Rosa chinensis]
MNGGTIDVLSWHQGFTSITLLAMNIPVISQKLEGGHAPGWQDVQPHDPQVQDAANHAVKSLQQKSNSLFPYELQEIVHAKAENASPKIQKMEKMLKLQKLDPLRARMLLPKNQPVEMTLKLQELDEQGCVPSN